MGNAKFSALSWDCCSSRTEREIVDLPSNYVRMASVGPHSFDGAQDRL